MNQRRALIPGASGSVGRGLAGYLALQPEWQVIGCARRAPAVTSLKRARGQSGIAHYCKNIVLGVEAVEWFGVFAPAALSKPLLGKIRVEVLVMRFPRAAA